MAEELAWATGKWCAIGPVAASGIEGLAPGGTNVGMEIVLDKPKWDIRWEAMTSAARLCYGALPVSQSVRKLAWKATCCRG